MRLTLVLAVVVTAAALASCASSGPKAAASTPAPLPLDGAATKTSAAAAEIAARAAELAMERERRQLFEAMRQDNVVYFYFDRSDIRDERRPIIARFGSYLSAHPAARVRLERHTDERGSREYNVALGGRRAQTVRLALVAQGARDAQLRTFSYGPERPAVDGHDEAAWSRNRRAEIVFENVGAEARKSH